MYFLLKMFYIVKKQNIYKLLHNLYRHNSTLPKSEKKPPSPNQVKVADISFRPKIRLSDLLSDSSGHLPVLPPVGDKGTRKYTESMQVLKNGSKSYQFKGVFSRSYVAVRFCGPPGRFICSRSPVPPNGPCGC